MIETIRELIALGFTGCYISFNPGVQSQEYYIKLFSMICEQGIQFNILFSAWRLASHELLDEFAKSAGPKSSYIISPETGSERLRKMGRGFNSYTNSDLLDNLEYADKLGIKTTVYFSLGVLEQNRADFDETLALKKEITNKIRKSEIEAYLVEIEPSAPLHFDPERYNIRLLRRSLADFVRDHSSPTYSSRTSMGYTNSLFGDLEMDPDIYNRKLLKLRCRYFCKHRLGCAFMSLTNASTT